MATFRVTGEMSSSKGILRRIEDAELDNVEDPRHQPWVVHPLGALLCLAVVALATGARSTRAVEYRSEQLHPKIRHQFELEERVSDNAFGLVLPRLVWSELRRALHRQVKAEWRRRNLRPSRLSHSTVAIDGKHMARIPEWRLRAIITRQTSLDGQNLTNAELKTVLKSQLPYVQWHDRKEESSYGLVRVHRATLISSDAGAVIDQWPIRGETNEEGTINTTLGALLDAYGRTNIVELVTLDAGNATRGMAQTLQHRDVDYLMAIKSPQGAIHQMAVDTLAEQPGNQAGTTIRYREDGKTICYTVWTHRVDDDLGWLGASQLVRVERVVVENDGDITVGNRFFVTSLGGDQLDSDEALKLVKAHWRCENNGHWTADAIWEEDAYRTPWTSHPDGILAVGLLRMIAFNILSVMRTLSRIKNDKNKEQHKPTWKMVIEQALLVTCRPLLNMTRFNAFE